MDLAAEPGRQFAHLPEQERRRHHQGRVSERGLRRLRAEAVGDLQAARILRPVSRDAPRFRAAPDGAVRHLLLFQAPVGKAHHGARRFGFRARADSRSAGGRSHCDGRAHARREGISARLDRGTRLPDRQGGDQGLRLRQSRRRHEVRAEQGRRLRQGRPRGLRLSRTSTRTARRTTLGQKFARATLESRQARDQRRYAEGNAPSLFPGGLVKLRRHDVGSENRDYLLVAARHSVVAQQYRSGGGEAGEAYSGNYLLQPKDRPFRAPQVTPRPVVHGPQTALVVGPCRARRSTPTSMAG